MAGTVTVSPVNLLIDEANPRIEQPNAGQPKALQSLAKHLGPKLVALAGDIVGFGIDPSNMPIVTPAEKPGSYIVLEGNRRLAALKALENPESVAVALKSGDLIKLRRLSRTYQSNPVLEIECVVRTREQARHWIELRHTGENGGAGVVRWGSDDSARFRARSNPGKLELHSQAMNFLQDRGDLTPETRREIPATSLKRLLESPAVRSKLGIEAVNGKLELRGDEAKVAKALMHVVTDLQSKETKVKDIYTKELREAYAENLPRSIVVPTAATTKTGASTVKGASGPAAKQRGFRFSTPRDRLIPAACAMKTKGRIRKIEEELRKLSLKEFTNAVSVLFRVFTELSVDEYLSARSIPVEERTALQKKMEMVVKDLLKHGRLTDKEATPVRRACQKDSFLGPSMTLMHQYLHNPHLFPAPGDLRAHWDSLSPFFVAIWPPK